MITVLAALLLGCSVPTLAPGEWGPLRYFDEVPGTVPLRFHPPLSDRDGNAYLLFGDRDRTESLVYVGHDEGGWSGGCQAHDGLFGVHGLLGTSETRGWYWSGDVLVEVDGTTGSCDTVLDTDPISGTVLSFVAVVPWIQETVSRTQLLAMIQGASDPLPFYAVIDLDNERYVSLREFELQDAESVEIVGTGADPDAERGYVVATVTTAKSTRTFVVSLDADGRTLSTIELDEVLEENAILGFAQGIRGTGAALLEDGRVLTFDEQAAAVVDPDPLVAGGLLRRDDDLWVTGLLEESAALASVASVGQLGPPQAFAASSAAAAALDGQVAVLDERTDPTLDAIWKEAGNAIGPAPFVSPYLIDVYTNESTGWVVAGPTFSTGIEDATAVAFGPVGIGTP